MCYKQKCKVVSLNLAHPVYFSGKLSLMLVNSGVIYKIKRSNVKVTGNENVKKILFVHIIIKRGSIFVKSRTK